MVGFCAAFVCTFELVTEKTPLKRVYLTEPELGGGDFSPRPFVFTPGFRNLLVGINGFHSCKTKKTKKKKKEKKKKKKRMNLPNVKMLRENAFPP